MADYSLSDLAAVSGENGLGGGSWIVLIILFAMIFGWGGNGTNGRNNATTNDVVYTSAFNQLQSENLNIINEIQRAAAGVTTTVKDGQYNNLSEIRDLQATTNAGFANMQNCCCEALRAIDGVNYTASLNTRDINATTVAQTQKILDAIAADKISTLQNQVNQLSLQQAMCGVPKINPYFYGIYPYGTGCNCTGNI